MAVPQQYLFPLLGVYIRTQADNAEIARDQAAGLKWGKGYVNFKQNIRTYLKLAQNGRCAFCRCKIDPGTSESNLEHLINKKHHPRFSFTTENLVYACWNCNKAKGQQITTTIAIVANTPYPHNTNDFLIINPYYDDFDAHLDFIDDVIIIVSNNSIKGANTIRMCKLSRPELAESRAREFRLVQQTVNQNLLARLTQPNLDPGTMAQLQAVIAQMPDWTL